MSSVPDRFQEIGDSPIPPDDGNLRPLAGSDAEWRARLSPEQYNVLRQAGTERPFSGDYVDTDDNGLYRCAACGNPLFDSTTKFHSGTGWPSFTESVSPTAVDLVEDPVAAQARHPGDVERGAEQPPRLHRLDRRHGRAGQRGAARGAGAEGVAGGDACGGAGGVRTG